jgi:hypothetical protein
MVMKTKDLRTKVTAKIPPRRAKTCICDSKGGWAEALRNRVEKRLKVIGTEYEGTLTKAR